MRLLVVFTPWMPHLDKDYASVNNPTRINLKEFLATQAIEAIQ